MRRSTINSVFNQDREGLNGAIEDAKDKAYLAGAQHIGNKPAAMIQVLFDEQQEIVTQLQSFED